jgi:LysR family transcriptional regulator, hca operon transcriptional activator
LVIGFLSGYELEWLPEIARLLLDQLGRTELVLQSSSSPDLIRLLKNGSLDVAFLRPERNTLEVAFKRVIEEPLMAILPSAHRLAKRRFVRPSDLENEVLIGVSHEEAPTLREVIDTYLKRSKITLRVAHEAVNLPTIFSLVLSTPGVSLLPTFARKLAPPSIICIPVEPDAPKVELAIGYNKTNASGLLRLFLSRVDELILERAGAPN